MAPVFDFSVYLGLFLSAFGAASLLPLQSEALLVGLCGIVLSARAPREA